MNEDRSTSKPLIKKSLFERIGDVLTGELKDRAQLIEIVNEAYHKQILDGDSLRIIEGAMNVSDLHVRDIMIPRSQMICLEHDETVKEWIARIVESGHSRFPVVGENPNEVIGIVLAKDMLSLAIQTSFDESEMQNRLRRIIREVTYVPESKRVNVLLRDFRQNRNHLAIVVDEYRGISGLVTIEDVLEEIVGEIEDEHDEASVLNIASSDGTTYTVQALTPIDEFNDKFGTNLSDDEFDTIGGIVTHKFGRVPKKNESILLAGMKVIISRADNRRVRTFEVCPKQ